VTARLQRASFPNEWEKNKIKPKKKKKSFLFFPKGPTALQPLPQLPGTTLFLVVIMLPSSPRDTTYEGQREGGGVGKREEKVNTQSHHCHL
jgi:hypothetical protein